MLAVCGGGGSNAAALLATALAIAAWILVVALVVRTAEGRRERKALIALTLISALAGPAILFGPLAGLSSDNSRLLEIVVTLLLPGLIGACVVVSRRAARPARAFFLALWGAIFIVGAYMVLVIAFLAIGDGCLS